LAAEHRRREGGWNWPDFEWENARIEVLEASGRAEDAQAARWFELADLAGETRAAKMLGDEAFVRLVKTTKPEDTDRAVLDTAIGWYEKALEVEPVPEAKAEVEQSLALLSNLKQTLSAR